MAANRIFGARINELDQRTRERRHDVSGAFCMHADAILSRTLVIRQPQLITRASNIYASRKPRFIYKRSAIYHVPHSHGELRRRSNGVFSTGKERRKNSKMSYIHQEDSVYIVVNNKCDNNRL